MNEENEETTELEKLQGALEECQKLRDEYLAGWQRAKADFLNYKKEEMSKVKSMMEFLKASWISELLKILDNFELAQKHLPKEIESSEWAKGFAQIQQQFNEFLKNEGVEEIKALGEKFDPNFHEALEEIDAEGKETGEVVEVLEKGYTINNLLLRPAKVRVSK